MYYVPPEFVEAKIANEIRLELVSNVDHFITLPLPQVRYSGAAAAAVAAGEARSLENVVKLTANNNYYIVLIELPQVLLDSDSTWIVNDDNEYVYGGHVSRAALYADEPTLGNEEGSAQLCQTEPWSISFTFPGLVDSEAAWQVLVPSTKIMGMSARKINSLEEKGKSRGNQFEISDVDEWLI